MAFFTNSIGSFIILWLSSLHILAIGSYLNNGTHDGVCRTVKNSHHMHLGVKEIITYGMGCDLPMLLQARRPVS